MALCRGSQSKCRPAARSGPWSSCSRASSPGLVVGRAACPRRPRRPGGTRGTAAPGLRLDGATAPGGTADVPHATAPDGVPIAYQVRGSGDPLVLLSGQANSHEWWDDVRDDFHGSRTTITLDYRGTGDSGE